jgi:Cytochrome c7 and related cytochrome c
MKKNWLIGGLAGVFALTAVAFVQSGGTQEPAAEVAADSGQPIAFPHDIHAGSERGQSNMDCQFCHYSAERSVDAGIPSVATCWGCHQAVPGTNNPEEVAKIRGYMDRNEPIPWKRIYKIADHAHFPHMRHINAGLQCQQCHGEVQEQKVITERDPVWGGANMGWCVECHRQTDPETGKQQASTDCAVCHY